MAAATLATVAADFAALLRGSTYFVSSAFRPLERDGETPAVNCFDVV